MVTYGMRDMVMTPKDCLTITDDVPFPNPTHDSGGLNAFLAVGMECVKCKTAIGYFSRKEFRSAMFNKKLKKDADKRRKAVCLAFREMLADHKQPYDFDYYCPPVTPQPKQWECGYLSVFLLIINVRGMYAIREVVGLLEAIILNEVGIKDYTYTTPDGTLEVKPPPDAICVLAYTQYGGFMPCRWASYVVEEPFARYRIITVTTDPAVGYRTTPAGWMQPVPAFAPLSNELIRSYTNRGKNVDTIGFEYKETDTKTKHTSPIEIVTDPIVLDSPKAQPGPVQEGAAEQPASLKELVVSPVGATFLIAKRSPAQEGVREPPTLLMDLDEPIRGPPAVDQPKPAQENNPGPAYLLKVTPFFSRFRPNLAQRGIVEIPSSPTEKTEEPARPFSGLTRDMPFLWEGSGLSEGAIPEEESGPGDPLLLKELIRALEGDYSGVPTSVGWGATSREGLLGNLLSVGSGWLQKTGSFAGSILGNMTFGPRVKEDPKASEYLIDPVTQLPDEITYTGARPGTDNAEFQNWLQLDAMDIDKKESIMPVKIAQPILNPTPTITGAPERRLIAEEERIRLRAFEDIRYSPGGERIVRFTSEYLILLMVLNPTMRYLAETNT
ncbi:hypothetical protein BKA56DRAFT_708977 [Ilyonectria sp. MPI-CAGE-AT-0026]|nr:hypothetical protein BKA56DRAFT_708977 [Ilyonectria sp. MPI-CAGE-AT-0026]